MLVASRQRGDTLIEVLLAVTVFGIVAAGAMTIMNRGVAGAQRALEITLVRQQIDAQAEALRAAHQAYAAQGGESEEGEAVWQEIIGANTGRVVLDGKGCPDQATLNGTADIFAMHPTEAIKLLGSSLRSINSDGAPVYSQTMAVDGEDDLIAYGLWIERMQAGSTAGGVPTAYDFRIRACWNSSGQETTPVQIETVVRLYDIS